jgi:hypothetical protein
MTGRTKNSNTRITKTKRNMTYFVGNHMKKKGTNSSNEKNEKHIFF